MFKLASYSVARRLGLLTLSAVLGLIILLTYFMVSERNMLLQERQASVRQTVEVAHGVVAHFHDLSTKGKMSEDEAKKAAMAALKTLRYSGNEYFWINDMQPEMVMHPIRPELDGKDLAENKDPTGKPLFVAFVDVVKAKGAGDVPYLWPKPGSDKPVLKVSHVKGFAPWGWIIGSGVYVDTVDAGPLPQRLLASCALPHAWADLPAWTVLDTGFGVLTPFLHCWHTWQTDARRPRMLHYVGMLSLAQAQQLPTLAQQAAQSIPLWRPLAETLAAACADLAAGQHRILLAQGQLSLTLCIGDTTALLAEQQFLANTLWVHGAHTPWDKWRIKALARCSQRGARLALDITAPEAPAWLAEAGYVDVQQDGHGLQASFQPRWSLGARDQAATTMPPQRCTVLGAGISGASVAYALARRGWQVTVLDQHAAAAGGASGLPAGLVVPHVSADDSPRSRMSRVGARLMQQHAKTLLRDGMDWQASGVQEQDLEQGSTRWHAHGAWVRPGQLVRAWLKHPGIRCVYGARITDLQQREAVWQLIGPDGNTWAESELVVLANATGCVPLMLHPAHVHFLGDGLPQRLEFLHAVHGTVSYAAHRSLPPAAHWPQHPVNGHGNFLPQIPLDNGMAWLAGSTFEPDRIPEQTGHRLAPLTEQHRANAQRLGELLPAVGAELATAFAAGEVQHWSATRCVTHDRLPLVGPLQDVHEGSRPSLWIHAGMGARGLTFSALGAELLVARLAGEPWPLESSLARSLDVRRPKRRRS